MRSMWKGAISFGLVYVAGEALSPQPAIKI
jgi:non-homologous end joining protein Ku